MPGSLGALCCNKLFVGPQLTAATTVGDGYNQCLAHLVRCAVTSCLYVNSSTSNMDIAQGSYVSRMGRMHDGYKHNYTGRRDAFDINRTPVLSAHFPTMYTKETTVQHK